MQARTGSSRFPNKVLQRIGEHPMLWHVCNRLKDCRTLNMIVVATSKQSADRQIVDLAQRYDVRAYVGSELDVLDRYYQCATALDIKTIVRITGDCPLIDPAIVDRTVAYYLTNQFDYISTSKNYFDGMDVEVFSYMILKKAWGSAKTPRDREHVTPWMIRNLNCGDVPSKVKYPKRHLSVDTKEDYELICKIYEKCEPGFGIDTVVGAYEGIQKIK